MNMHESPKSLKPEVVIPAEVDLFRKSFYGNKREMLAPIANLIPFGTRTVADIFGGTGVVAWYLKHLGFRVLSNDVMRFPSLTLRAIVENNGTQLDEADLRLLSEPKRGKGDHIRRFYRETFGPSNSDFLDAWAANIPRLADPTKRDIAAFIPIACISKPLSKYAAIHWTALGTLTGYRHLWYFDLEKEVRHYALNILPHLVFDNAQNNQVFNEDALDLVSRINADILYLDPPYACRAGSYEGTYALFDDLVSILSGRGNLIKDPYDSRSELGPYTYFGTRKSALTGFARLFERSRHIPNVIVSYNTTSLISPSEIASIAKVYRKTVSMQFIDRPRPTTIKNRNTRTQEMLMLCR